MMMLQTNQNRYSAGLGGLARYSAELSGLTGNNRLVQLEGSFRNISFNQSASDIEQSIREHLANNQWDVVNVAVSGEVLTFLRYGFVLQAYVLNQFTDEQARASATQNIAEMGFSDVQVTISTPSTITDPNKTTAAEDLLKIATKAAATSAGLTTPIVIGAVAIGLVLILKK